MENNVWIVNKKNHDYSSAYKFGKVKVLTQGKFNIFNTKKLKEAIIPVLEREASENDFVILSGYIIANALVIHYFLNKYGKVNILIWDCNAKKYLKVTLTDY